MKIVRLYSGSDEKSHFEEIDLKFGGNQPMLSTDMRAATGAVFRSAPVGLFLDRLRRRAGSTSLRSPAHGKLKPVMALSGCSKPATSCSPTTPPAKATLRACSAAIPMCL
jgi:hypothetical protein